MDFYKINVSSKYSHTVNCIEKGFEEIFSRVHKGSVYIINHFPAATDSLGEIDLLIFINVTNIKGNYYKHKEKDGSTYYLNNLVIGIKIICDDNIVDIDESTIYDEEGNFDYIESLKQEQDYFCKFSELCKQPIRNCTFFYWIKSKGCKKTFANDYIVFNKDLVVSNLLHSACHRTLYGTGISCFQDLHDVSEVVQNYIEQANACTDIGVLTKKRIDKITEQGLRQPQKIIDNQGKALTIIDGKAGCGKTLLLMRVLHKIIAGGHHCRLLTYNNLLVYDFKHCIRQLNVYKNTNANIQTLHKYFYDLFIKLGIRTLSVEKRLQELMDVCESRVEIANKKLIEYYDQEKQIISRDTFFNKYKQELESGDYWEIRQYVDYVNKLSKQKKTDTALDLKEIKNNYIKEKRRRLENLLGNQFFKADYYKVLETIYFQLTNTYEFYEKYNIKERRKLLNKVLETDKMSESESNKEYSYKEFESDVNRIIRYRRWAKAVLIDEAQDWHLYEKLIIMKIWKPENIIVASGGKDQLIKSSNEMKWTVEKGKPIIYETISLGNKTFRQKKNIVRFINAFAEYYKLTKPIRSNNLEGGRVIIDVRKDLNANLENSLKNLRESGKIYGCSDYENCMVLLSSEYTIKEKTESVIVDELDNVHFVEQTTNRKLVFDVHDINCWNGIAVNKSALSVPNANQTRIIHYESCRGLEAWNVLCVDLDYFFEICHNGKDAQIYAATNRDLFTYGKDGEEMLKTMYALRWVYMVMTRPIDTLYIRLKNPASHFSTKLLEIGRENGAEILYDTQEI